MRIIGFAASGLSVPLVALGAITGAVSAAAASASRAGSDPAAVRSILAGLGVIAAYVGLRSGRRR